MLEDLIYELAPYIISALGMLASYVLAKLSGYLKSKTDSQYLSDAMQRLMGEANLVMLEMKQSVVEDLKKAKADGKLTAGEKAMIRERALVKLKSNIGLKGLARLARILGIDSAALDKMLGTRLEAAISADKAATDF